MSRLIIDLPDDQEFEKSVQNAYEAMAKQMVRNAVDKAMEEELGRVVNGRISKYLEAFGNPKLVSIIDNAMTSALHIEVERAIAKCAANEALIRRSAEKVYEDNLAYAMRFNGESVQDYLARKINEYIEDAFEKKLKAQLPGAIKEAFGSLK
ncbi:MAG: hypothetical protein E7576_07680 [Ruminococcaceae bacterium]|nr:hypothetical protein [Oscillospiraceae bacterium]